MVSETEDVNESMDDFINTGLYLAFQKSKRVMHKIRFQQLFFKAYKSNLHMYQLLVRIFVSKKWASKLAGKISSNFNRSNS